jgi:hypothetical protein
MKSCIFFIVLAALLGSTCIADESILLQRIIALEKRIAELEKKLEPVLEEERIKAIVAEQQKRAFDRMMVDAEMMPRPELRKVEQIYKAIQADWKSEEARTGLKMLKEKYPMANRTGCAMLYMAQMTKGSERLDYLKQSIEKYSSCYYETGVNVGAYARLYLGMHYQNEGKGKEASALFEDIRSLYPDAIDHKGKLLTDHLEEL